MDEEREITGSEIEWRYLVDPETGCVFHKRDSNRRFSGAYLQAAGYIKRGTQNSGGGYRIVHFRREGKGYDIRAHHLVWVWMTGVWPNGEIDHINGNRDDNRFVNLREVTVSQNRTNRRISSNNKSGYKLVHWDKQKMIWKVDIREPGGRKLLFYFTHHDPKVAHKAACEAAKGIFGEFYNPG